MLNLDTLFRSLDAIKKLKRTHQHFDHLDELKIKIFRQCNDLFVVFWFNINRNYKGGWIYRYMPELLLIYHTRIGKYDFFEVDESFLTIREEEYYT